MAFPKKLVANGGEAQSALVNAANGMGLKEPGVGLSGLDYMSWAVSELLQDTPSSGTITFVPTGVYPVDAVNFLGDSITYQLGTLNTWFGVTANTWVNAGVGGDASFSVLARVGTAVNAAISQTCLLLIGINDIGGGAGSGGSYEDVIPPGTVTNGYTSTASYITQIVNNLTARGVRPILATVLPTAKVYVNGLGIPGTTINARIVTLNTYLKNYAAINGLVIVDYYSAFVGPDGYGVATLYNPDGIHPNAAGQAILTAAAAVALRLDNATYPVIHGTSANFSAPVNANGGIVVDTKHGATGKVSFDASLGMLLRGSAGTTSDLSLYTAGGSPVLTVPITTANATFPSAINADAGISFDGLRAVTGKITFSASYGMNLRGSTGSTADWTVFTPAGSVVMQNNTGTADVLIGGTLITTRDVNVTRDLYVTGKFGANNATPQAKYSVGAAATDLATVLVLANNLRTMSINCGLAV
jgi:lysophospholipase L1-like esterase